MKGQTKQKLGNSEARGAVDAVVSEKLTYFLEQNRCSQNICEKSLLAQRAREAARKARDRPEERPLSMEVLCRASWLTVQTRILKTVKFS